MGKQNLVEQIRKGNDATLGELYAEYREEFVLWSRKSYGLSHENAIEVYQQSIVSLYENAVSGKLNQLSSELKTYLFGIGKNKVREHIRKHKKELQIAGHNSEVENGQEIEEKIEKEKKLEALSRSFKKLSDGCQKLLQMFYYQNLRMDDIVEQLGYKNSSTAKNQKYKCMQQLRKIHLG